MKSHMFWHALMPKILPHDTSSCVLKWKTNFSTDCYIKRPPTEKPMKIFKIFTLVRIP